MAPKKTKEQKDQNLSRLFRLPAFSRHLHRFSVLVVQHLSASVGHRCSTSSARLEVWGCVQFTPPPHPCPPSALYYGSRSCSKRSQPAAVFALSVGQDPPPTCFLFAKFTGSHAKTPLQRQPSIVHFGKLP